MENEKLDYIVNLEKAITQKYGKETIQNPKGNWDEGKEKEYLEQLKKISKKERTREEQSEKVEINGFLVYKKLLNRETKRNCPVCKVYSFNIKDDSYLLKYECCYMCYTEYVEDREERWQTGWRPNLGENKCQKKH